MPALRIPNQSRIWFGTKETWPIIGAMGFAGCWLGYMGGRFLFTHPDVQWNKSNRSQIVRENHEEGDKWSSFKKGMVVQDISKIGIMKSSTPKY